MRTRSSKGWGQLPRTIARALAGARINGSESRIIWAIIYKTIAFNKVNDGIPWSQISDLTGIDEWNLTRGFNSLLKKGIIFKKDSVYGIQNDFSKWKIPSNQMVIKETPSDSKDLPSDSKDLPSDRMDSRDLSKRAFQEKGLSAKLGKEQIEKNKEGITRSKELFKRLLAKQEKKDKAFKKD